MMQNILQPYLKISKFKVVLLMLVTALVGVALAPKPEGWSILHLFAALVGIMLVASSGGSINHLAEIKVDEKMNRTAHRPLPQGQLSELHVLIFSIACMVLGSLILVLSTNLLCVLLTISAMIGYAVVYTLWLKPITPQNIVIGGLSGALPPLLGWVSVTGKISAEPLILVLIIFTWTPPHFWALAINRLEDYKKIDYPMLPVTHGVKYTSLSITLYTILMILSTQLPFVIGMNGIIYLVIANILNMLFLFDVILLQISPTTSRGFGVFYHSIIYLFLLFSVMIIDHFFHYELIIY